MLNNILSAGIARADITPPLGFRMQGAMRRVEGAEGIESNLLATVLVITDNNNKIAILDCDLVGFDLPLAKEIRQKIGQAIGCLLYTSPSPRDRGCSRMPSSA